MSTLVVVNPASAGGRTGRHWPQLRRCLQDAGVDFEYRLTGAPGEATTLTRDALREGRARVVAAGGDGTLNEVVNGFFEADGTPVSPDAVVGMLPSGTGGDFRKTVGIPTVPAAAAALLARGDVRRVDVGRIEYLGAGGPPPRYFVNIADCGIGGDVVARVNAHAKGAGGKTTFLYHSLRALLAYRNRPARVDVDGTVLEGPVQNVVVANGRYFGGGMLVAPGADPADGQFDVVVLGDLSRVRSFLEMRRIYDGSHVGRPDIRVLRGRRVGVTPLDGPLLFDVEGEQVGQAPATLTCLPGALAICAPARG